jgi:hypothetical protein
VSSEADIEGLMSLGVPELVHFMTLSPAEKLKAIEELAAAGWSDFGISGATRLSVEQVRKIRGTSAPSVAASAQEPLRGV